MLKPIPKSFSSLLMSPLPFPSSLISPSSPLDPSFFYSFTDAIVAVEFTRRDIDGHYSFRDWDKGKALVLTVGDVITDVKLVCS